MKLSIGFYNVVLSVKEINGKNGFQKQSLLKTDIVKAFKHHEVDILCLSALWEINEIWIKRLVAQSKDLQEVPIIIYSDDHYVTLAKNTRVRIKHYELVKNFVPEQRERSFQLFRVHVTGAHEEVCIINCDVLASKTMDLSPNSKMCYFRTFHKLVGANPFIWGRQLQH